MKKYIKSTEIPDGYLKTSKFTAPSIKTREQRNALEALEIAIVEKFPQFDRFCDRQVYFTSGAHWQGVIDEYESGYYIQLTATQSAFNAFVAKDKVIRKPVGSKLGKLIRSFEVDGDNGQVDRMSQAREIHN